MKPRAPHAAMLFLFVSRSVNVCPLPYAFSSRALPPETTALSSQSVTSLNCASSTPGEATTTYAVFGRRLTYCAASLSLRFARLRRTALPTPLPATTPSSGFISSPAAWRTVIPPERLRVPERYIGPNRDPGLRGRKDRTLCGELVTALGTATLQQRATLAGAHSATEAVLALSATVTGLICTLHNEVSLVGEVAVNP